MIKSYLKILFSRKITKIIYIVFLTMVTVHFMCTVTQYHGYDCSSLPRPYFLTVLTSLNTIGFLFLQYYPVIVVLPTAFEFISDCKSREIIYLQSRCGKKNYIIMRTWSVFIGTVIIYTFPLLLELGALYIAFPLYAKGNLFNVSSFDSSYVQNIDLYLFSNIYKYNGILYTVCMIVIFGILSGMLACFAQNLSMIFKYKFRIFVFLPVYVLFILIRLFGDKLKIPFSTDYFNYINIFSLSYKSEKAFIVFMLVLCVLNGLILCFVVKKDEVI